MTRKQKASPDAIVAELFLKSEEKISSILAGITDCHFELDRDWRFIRINDQSLAYFGGKREELIGQSYFETFPALRDSIFKEQYNEAISKSTSVHFDVESVLYPGKWIEIHVYPTEERGISVFFRDVTEHKRAEEDVRQSEEHLRFALETIHTGAWDLNLVDHSAFRSLEHDRIFGYDKLLPEWTYEMFLEHVLPEDCAMVDRKFRLAMENQTDWNFECRIQRTDGQIRWISAAGRHTQDAAGAPHRMAGIVQTSRAQTDGAGTAAERTSVSGNWGVDQLWRLGVCSRREEHLRQRILSQDGGVESRRVLQFRMGKCAPPG